MTQYFTAQNFVYWTIAYAVSYVWMAMVANRISVMAGKSYHKPLTFSGLFFMFFTWPVWFVIMLFVDIVSLVAPHSLAEQLRKK